MVESSTLPRPDFDNQRANHQSHAAIWRITMHLCILLHCRYLVSLCMLIRFRSLSELWETGTGAFVDFSADLIQKLTDTQIFRHKLHRYIDKQILHRYLHITYNKGEIYSQNNTKSNASIYSLDKPVYASAQLYNKLVSTVVITV